MICLLWKRLVAVTPQDYAPIEPTPIMSSGGDDGANKYIRGVYSRFRKWVPNSQGGGIALAAGVRLFSKSVKERKENNTFSHPQWLRLFVAR